MEAPDFMEIEPMVLALDIQILEPRPYDYAEYVVDNIHTSFVNFEDVEYPTLNIIPCLCIWFYILGK